MARGEALFADQAGGQPVTKETVKIVAARVAPAADEAAEVRRRGGAREMGSAGRVVHEAGAPSTRAISSGVRA